MIPPAAQTLLFSATFPDRVDAFAKRFAPDANEIRLKPEELSVEGIKQFYMDCESEEVKYDVLLELYNLLTIGQSIIFCAVSTSCVDIRSGTFRLTTPIRLAATRYRR